MCNSYDRSSALRYKHGLVGYAVYCRMLELCSNSPNGRLKYDVSAVAWDLRDDLATTRLIDSVVRDFDLFILGDDGYVEDAFCPSSVYLQRQKEQEIKAARSAAGKKGAATRAANKAKKEAASTLSEQTNAPEQNPTESQTTLNDGESQKKKTSDGDLSQNEYYRYQNNAPLASYDAEKLEKVKAAWNEVYAGVRGQKQTWLVPPQTIVETFRNVSAEFSVDDFRDAFQMARKDSQITWRFGSAVKQVGFLLGKIETEKNAQIQKQREQDERDGIDRTSQAYKENLAALERMWEEGTVDPENPNRLLKDRPKTIQQKIEEEIGW